VAQANDRKEILHQNLIDAGCPIELTRICMELAEQGNNNAMIEILSRHRQDLLNNIHQGQDALDCLDYLVHQLKKRT